MKKTISLKEDLKSSLPKVQRWWIRKPLVLALSFPMFPFAIIVGVMEGYRIFRDDFFNKCWKGSWKH